MFCKGQLFLACFILVAFVVTGSKGQNFWKTQFKNDEPVDDRFRIVWCTISGPELMKCKNFASANEWDKIKVGYTSFKIECIQTSNKGECMQALDLGNATVMTLDAGQVYVGGRHYSLVPLAQEVLSGGALNYYSVAVVKKGSIPHVRSLADLRGARACFPSVDTYAGWILPIYTLMREGGLEIIDCNNHVKSAAAFFGPSCAANSLSDRVNPIGDNSDKLCRLCVGRIPGQHCNDNDPYSGYAGAFRCLIEAGDVAFLKHTTVQELAFGPEFPTESPENYELLCRDRTRRPLSEYLQCNWDEVPSDAVVASSAMSYEHRELLQKFLEEAAALYSQGQDGQPGPPESPPVYRPSERPFDDGNNQLYRVKRQNFDNNANPQEQNRYNENRDRFAPNNEQYPQNPQNGDRNSNLDPNRERDPSNPYADNAFSRDPYRINKNQYGQNIDPYGDPMYNRDPDYARNNTNIYPIPVDHGVRGNDQRYEVFHIFKSSLYGYQGNLMFQDNAIGLSPVFEKQQTYTTFLGPSVMETIMGIRFCPVGSMTICVTSKMELEKCVKMKTALKAQLLKPEMNCFKAHSHLNCMQAIRNGDADVAVLDAGDVYTAGLDYDLVPFMSEIYNLPTPEYYVVAVAKESDPSTDLTYLRGKRTCHVGINTAAGWIYPLAFLLSNGWMRGYGCDSIRAAAEYFTKSCVPGAISAEYNTGVPYDNMCHLCHGTSFRYCRRDASEDYYGHTGAFRCLVEGGGHVAFVKHTTVSENTGLKKREWWVRDNLNDDFELLCPDGTRAEVNEYTKCNLGKVKSNAIVTRRSEDETEIKAYINLFLYAQTFYGRKTADEFSFSMFSTEAPYSDLIFQDATTQLKVVPRDQRDYSRYLGPDFLRARRIVDCHSGAPSIFVSVPLLFSAVLAVIRVGGVMV